MLAGLGAEVLQRLADGSVPGSGERAGRLNDLSVRLADLGRREEAPAAIEDAVTIRRELARARPDAGAALRVLSRPPWMPAARPGLRR